MLSAWYPLTMASEARPAGTRSRLLSGAPNRLFTAQAPAAALAALLPMPLPKGRPCMKSFRAQMPVALKQPLHTWVSLCLLEIPGQFPSWHNSSCRIS